MPQPRHILRFFVMLFFGLLSGCGFHLSNPSNIPFSSIYIEGNGVIVGTLRNMIIHSGHPDKLAKSAATSERVLQILNETNLQLILAITSTGLVSEYQLNYSVSYQVLTPDGKVVSPPTSINLSRDMNFNPTQPYAYGGEQTYLIQDMQTDAAQQILRRISQPQKPLPAPAPDTADQ